MDTSPDTGSAMGDLTKCCACQDRKSSEACFTKSGDIEEKMFRARMCDQCVEMMTVEVAEGVRVFKKFSMSSNAFAHSSPVGLGAGIKVYVREDAGVDGGNSHESRNAIDFSSGSGPAISRTSGLDSLEDDSCSIMEKVARNIADVCDGGSKGRTRSSTNSMHGASSFFGKISATGSGNSTSFTRSNSSSSGGGGSGGNSCGRRATMERHASLSGACLGKGGNVSEEARESATSDCQGGYKRTVLRYGVGLIGVGLALSVAWAVKGARSSSR